MRADKGHQEGAEPQSGERTGPRHAAPRKPLFTRLQMPAGKAIALAAMPTAVLMGMGLTPTLASAKPLPKNPFQDGPCVTQPDESPEDSQKDDKAGKEKDKAKDESKGDKASPSPSATSKPSSSPKHTSSDDSKEPSPSASPSASGDSDSGGLLGGLGSALGSVLSPGEKESAKASPSPSPSASKSSGSAVDDVAGAVGDTVDKVTGGAKDTVDGVAGKAKDATKPSPSASEDESGKKAFPCVEEKKADGSAETPPAPIPNQPWHLEASSLTLQGMHYEGVVNLTMPNGQTKQALKYTVKDGIDIGDLHQILTGPMGKQYHVQAAKGSTSTIRGGTVTLYTESLSGNLFGVIPITFDPEHPPPIDLPAAYFTNVKLTQAGQFGGNLTVPGLHNYITD